MDGTTLTTYSTAVAHRLPWGRSPVVIDGHEYTAADVIDQVLIVADRIGLLITRTTVQEPDPDAVHRSARLLAAASRSPRYCDGDGWQRLLDSQGNIDHAAATAKRYALDAQTVEEIAAAHGLLTRHLAGSL